MGSSLATLYFGHKQKRQFNRIKTFYEEVKGEIISIKNEIKNIKKHNPDEFGAKKLNPMLLVLVTMASILRILIYFIV